MVSKELEIRKGVNIPGSNSILVTAASQSSVASLISGDMSGSFIEARSVLSTRTLVKPIKHLPKVAGRTTTSKIHSFWSPETCPPIRWQRFGKALLSRVSTIWPRPLKHPKYQTRSSTGCIYLHLLRTRPSLRQDKSAISRCDQKPAKAKALSNFCQAHWRAVSLPRSRRRAWDRLSNLERLMHTSCFTRKKSPLSMDVQSSNACTKTV